MWSRKEIKKECKKNLHKNYWNKVFICLITLLLIGSYPITRSAISDGVNLIKEQYPSLSNNNLAEATGTTGGSFKIIFDHSTKIINSTKIYISDIEKSVSSALNDDNAGKTIFLVVATLISILFKIFFLNVLDVGERRFFLETRKYKKTKFTRILSNFKKEKYLKTVKTEFLKNLFLNLWNLTIIGGIIKSYSYRMVEYIIAENPNISSKEAITLSRKMMKGNKFKMFILDLSYIGYQIINVFTFGLLGILFINPYSKQVETEIYINLRKDKSLNDKELYINDEKDYYPGTEKEEKQLDYYRKYDLKSFILFFFAFAIAGWIWEVLLYIIKEGRFINRGTMIGPWLPIYGFGCVAVLLLLIPKKFKKITDNPILTLFIVMALCSTIEYLTSLYLEVFKCARWWDYTGYFMNINGRVCLECTFFFGIGGIACIYIIAPQLDKIIKKLSKKTTTIICVILVSLYVLDFIHSSYHPNMGAGITNINQTEIKCIRNS